MAGRPTESTSVAVVAVGTPSRAYVRENIFSQKSPIAKKVLARDTPQKQLLQLLHCYIPHESKPIPDSATATQLLQLLPTNIHANFVNGGVD
jgi:hypothetical protein